MPLHPGSERACIAEDLSSFPDLQKAGISESLRQKRLTEIVNMPWRYRKQDVSQVLGRSLALLSHSSATPAARASCSIVGDRSDIFYPPDSEARTGEHSDRRLRTGTRRSRLVASRSPHSDVKRGYASIFCNSRSCCSSLHRCVGRTLQTVGLDMLASSASGYGLSAAQIGDVNQCVVK